MAIQNGRLLPPVKGLIKSFGKMIFGYGGEA